MVQLLGSIFWEWWQTKISFPVHVSFVFYSLPIPTYFLSISGSFPISFQLISLMSYSFLISCSFLCISYSFLIISYSLLFPSFRFLLHLRGGPQEPLKVINGGDSRWSLGLGYVIISIQFPSTPMHSLSFNMHFLFPSCFYSFLCMSVSFLFSSLHIQSYLLSRLVKW